MSESLTQAINDMRTMRESYDVLATELADSKQTIVDAINQMGGSATTDMTWAQLAAQIEGLDILSPRTTVTSGTPRPINLADFCCAASTNGLVKVYSENVLSTRQYVFQSNLTIVSIELPNLGATLNPFSSNCPNLEEIIVPNATTINPNLSQNGTKLRKVNILNASALPTAVFNGPHPNLIDIIYGKGVVSNTTFAPLNPTNCYLTTSSSLCFDTDLEEYGQVFSNNFEKWKWCIINHFAVNLQDRTGMTAYTITFGSTVLSHFDAEMIAAFTDKNWTLA